MRSKRNESSKLYMYISTKWNVRLTTFDNNKSKCLKITIEFRQGDPLSQIRQSGIYTMIQQSETADLR